MCKDHQQLKTNDWSLNLEDPYYEEHMDALLAEAFEAVCKTAAGFYVNMVTPEKLGEPEAWLHPELAKRLQVAGQPDCRICFVDQCGCGGFVTRVYK